MGPRAPRSRHSTRRLSSLCPTPAKVWAWRAEREPVRAASLLAASSSSAQTYVHRAPACGVTRASPGFVRTSFLPQITRACFALGQLARSPRVLPPCAPARPGPQLERVERNRPLKGCLPAAGTHDGVCLRGARRGATSDGGGAGRPPGGGGLQRRRQVHQGEAVIRPAQALGARGATSALPTHALTLSN